MLEINQIVLLGLGLSVLGVAGCGPNPDDKQKVSEKERWNSKFSKEDYIYGKKPAAFLEANMDRLVKGKALDIAAGEGRNAVYLAEQGCQVDAIDISDIGLAKATQLAHERGVTINTIVADLTRYVFPTEEYDLVANFYYLQRDLIPQIKKTLKPGGIVIFETYTVDYLTLPQGKKFKREYCLEKNELKEFFQDFEIIHYEEVKDEKKAVAQIIARKAANK